MLGMLEAAPGVRLHATTLSKVSQNKQRMSRLRGEQAVAVGGAKESDEQAKRSITDHGVAVDLELQHREKRKGYSAV